MLFELIPGIRFKNSRGIKRLKCASSYNDLSSSSFSGYPKFSMFPTFPIFSIFIRSESLFAPGTFYFKSLKISAVCCGFLLQIICRFGKCKVSKEIFEIILPALTSAPTVESLKISCNLNGIPSSNSIRRTGLL